jgi:sugar/nucleoside kinase (ribokinase family)
MADSASAAPATPSTWRFISPAPGSMSPLRPRYSYSDAILALAAAEGVASDLVLRLRGRLPGLALVDSGADGARHRHDWRGESPARELFELPDWGRVAEGLTKAKLVYFSGITLSLYSNTTSAASSRSSRWRGSRA